MVESSLGRACKPADIDCTQQIRDSALVILAETGGIQSAGFMQDFDIHAHTAGRGLVVCTHRSHLQVLSIQFHCQAGFELADVEFAVDNACPARIVTGYRAPHAALLSNQEFLADIVARPSSAPLLVILGDFNCDTAISDALPLCDIGSTTNLGTAIDQCYTHQSCGTVETYFSYHKAVWMSLPGSGTAAPPLSPTHQQRNEPVGSYGNQTAR